MSLTVKIRVATLVGLAAMLTTAFAMTAEANASVIYACVAKTSGAARIVSKTAKCKKGEAKLSWNAEGPAGATGATGAGGATGAAGTAGKEGATGKEGAAGKEGIAGKNGANGAAAGFSATQSGVVSLGSEEELLVTKVLPAGSYLVAAKVEMRDEASGSGFVAVRCELWDASTKVELDEAELAGGVAEFASGKFGGAANLPLQAAITSSSPIELEVWCETTANKASAVIGLGDGKLMAVQTSSNG